MVQKKKKKKGNEPLLSSEVGCLATVILLSLSVVHCAIFFLFNFGLYNRQISLFTFLKKSEREAQFPLVLEIPLKILLRIQ